MRIAKGREITSAGHRHARTYANHDGWLFRYKLLHSGRRQILDFILPGEVFGFQACLFKSALYSVAAATDSTLTAFPADTIEQIFDHSSGLSKAVFWSAMREAVILGERLTNAGRRSAYERINHLMLELFERLSCAVRDGSFAAGRRETCDGFPRPRRRAGDLIEPRYAVSLKSSRPISMRRISEVPAPIS